MTDEQARMWHQVRKSDLRRLIDRAPDMNALAKIERSTAHELDADLRAHLARRVIAMKAGRGAN